MLASNEAGGSAFSAILTISNRSPVHSVYVTPATYLPPTMLAVRVLTSFHSCIEVNFSQFLSHQIQDRPPFTSMCLNLKAILGISANRELIHPILRISGRFRW